MKNILKKVALVLSFALVFAAMPMSVFADATVTTEADLKTEIANGGIVTLGANITLTETLTVPAGVTVTLDLAGNELTMVHTATVAANHEMIRNEGNLKIIDNLNTGKISYKYSGGNIGTSWAVNTITSVDNSVLTVKGGTIENLTYDSAIIAYAIDGRTNNPGYGDVTVNIDGGIITSERQSIRIFANSTTYIGALNISAGNITGRVIISNANTSANKAALNISGGTFNPNAYKTDVLNVGGDNGATIDMSPSITAGTFNGGVSSNMTTDFISGGTFTTDVSEFVVPGKIIDANGTVSCAHLTVSPWTVTTAPTCTAVGVETSACTTCGETYTREVAALGHAFGGWYTVKEPVCHDAGYEARVCTACGATESNPLPATTHNYDVNGVCAICGLTKAAVAAATPAVSAPSRANPNTGVHF